MTPSGATPAQVDGGRQALEDHFTRLLEQSDQDFRAASLNRLVASMLPRGRTLDIGCGIGGLSAELLRAGHDVVSQDASEAIVDLCRRYLAAHDLPTDGVRLGRIEDMDSDERYDSVVALDVIEHIEDDGAAVAAMRRCLSPGGRLLISVPAMSRLYGPKDVAVGHFRRYDRPVLESLLQSHGLRVESIRFWNIIGVPAVWLTARVLRRRLDEGFRYGDRSRLQRALNDALRVWLGTVEARLRPPAGLTLIACARPSDG